MVVGCLVIVKFVCGIFIVIFLYVDEVVFFWCIFGVCVYEYSFGVVVRVWLVYGYGNDNDDYNDKGFVVEFNYGRESGLWVGLFEYCFFVFSDVFWIIVIVFFFSSRLNWCKEINNKIDK